MPNNEVTISRGSKIRFDERSLYIYVDSIKCQSID